MAVKRPPVPSETVARLRRICLALPQVVEESAWVGTRWCVRGKTFAHVLMVEAGWPPAYAQAAGTGGPACLLTFRTLDRIFDPVDFEQAPYFRPVWFPNIVGVVVDDATDWDAVARFLTVSYRVLAPKALVEALDASDDGDGAVWGGGDF